MSQLTAGVLWCHHARSDAHWHQLLEEKFAGVRHPDQWDLKITHTYVITDTWIRVWFHIHWSWYQWSFTDWLVLYMDQVPESCCGSHDTRMCVCVCWRWPSVHTDYTREPDMDLKLQTDVLWGTELHHEQSDSHVPSRQNADRHRCKTHGSVRYQPDGLIQQIRSVSHRDRPSIGCLLRIWTGPRALEWILSSTMCFRRW